MLKTATPKRVEGTDILPMLCRLIRESGTTQENIENSYRLQGIWYRRDNIETVS